jgi:hypothetical protein
VSNRENAAHEAFVLVARISIAVVAIALCAKQDAPLMA